MKWILTLFVALFAFSLVAAEPTPLDDIKQAATDPSDSLQKEIFYGKLHVLKKADSQTVDLVTLELVGKVATENKIQALILVFGNNEREQAAQKRDGQMIYVEGMIGRSGTKAFVFVVSLLHKE